MKFKKRKIEIEIDNASVYELDVLCMSVRKAVQNCVDEFNRLNGSNLSIIKIGYTLPIHETVKPIPMRIEEKSNELFPESIIKKKDKSKPLKAAYRQGASDAMEMMEENYKKGIHPEDIFGTEQDTVEVS